MQIMSLNAWGARCGGEFYDFIAQWRGIVDVFCFQEIFAREEGCESSQTDADLDSYAHLQKLLDSYKGFHIPAKSNEEGLAVFVKQEFDVSYETGWAYLWQEFPDTSPAEQIDRPVQGARVTPESGKAVSVINFHGLWTGQGKGDISERIQQSQHLRAFMERFAAPKVLCGDFNLKPDTESLAIAGRGMRDLIDEYNVSTTRSSYYDKEMPFADYMFVSPELAVNKFRVLPDEVSDHLPLLVDIKIN